MVNGTIGLFVPETAIRERCARYMSKGGTRATRPAAVRRGLHDRRRLRLGVPRIRPVLPAGSGRPAPGPPALGHGDLHAQDPGREACLHRHEDGPRVQGMGHHQRRPRVGFQVAVPRDGRKPLVARFGGIPLERQPTAIIDDRKPPQAPARGNEFIRRLLAGRCGLCVSRTGLQVHHARKLADLGRPGRPGRPAWIRLMAKRERKTLVVCERCHRDIRAGRATATTRK
jgi:hypothetical protein